MTYGNLWAFPSSRALIKGRTAVVKSSYGKYRALRCPEVVLSLLTNPVRTEPECAITYRNVCDMRRIVLKNDVRWTRLMTTLPDAELISNVVGPAHGLINLRAHRHQRVQR